ncbi:MAG: DinB family protein [Candidatus Rokuibacteriota bacterium]
MTDEQLRILGYLTAQGAKLEPSEIVDKVRAAMDQLRSAVSAVPPTRFDERPQAEEWSANEVMAHVVTAGRFFGDAVIRLLDGLPGGGVRDRLERDAPRQSADAWWALLERDRTALFERVGQADPQSRLDSTVEHPFFGPLNWRETLLFMRLHDLDHAGQLQKIAAVLNAPRPA